MISAVVSLLAIAMLLDMLFFALHLYQQAVFGDLYGEGFLILYGLPGTPAQGILLLLAGRRLNGKSLTGS